MTLQIGDSAPDFAAETTEGLIRFHDWIGGKWAVLFSHPKDFTPVCTPSSATWRRSSPEFDRRDVKIIGLSVDPVGSHARWAADIEATQGAARAPRPPRHEPTAAWARARRARVSEAYATSRTSACLNVVLGLPGEARSRPGEDQTPGFQRRQRPPHVGEVEAVLNRGAPERTPHNRCLLQHPPLQGPAARRPGRLSPPRAGYTAALSLIGAENRSRSNISLLRALVGTVSLLARNMNVF